MFKLFTLLSSISFISTPAQQVYQIQKNNVVIENEIDEKKKEETETPLGGGGDTVGRDGTIDEIAKFDYLVPNWQ